MQDGAEEFFMAPPRENMDQNLLEFYAATYWPLEGKWDAFSWICKLDRDAMIFLWAIWGFREVGAEQGKKKKRGNASKIQKES